MPSDLESQNHGLEGNEFQINKIDVLKIYIAWKTVAFLLSIHGQR